jgi:hypothetical protein
MPRFNCTTVLLGASIAVTPALHAQRQDSDWMSLKPLLASIQRISTAPPKNIVTPKYISSALMGNGDIDVVAGGETVNQFRFYFGKSDFGGTRRS